MPTSRPVLHAALLTAAFIVVPAVPAAAAPARPADASCSPGKGWLCGISASSPGRAPVPRKPGKRPKAAASEQGDVITPMCAPTGGADHCLTITVPAATKTPTAEVAEMARDAIELPPPVPRTSPARRTWVGLPTHLWIDRAAWRTRTATVAVDGQRVTITGRPTHVAWNLGETTLTCDGPGIPAKRRASAAAGSACSHTFARATQRPFPVTATVFYDVTWTCTGACDTPGGTFDALPAAGTTALRVSEIQTTTNR